jgi:hypothetical protein
MLQIATGLSPTLQYRTLLYSATALTRPDAIALCNTPGPLWPRRQGAAQALFSNDLLSFLADGTTFDYRRLKNSFS